METNMMDEIDCGNFFDQIDDLIEFPPDNVDLVSCVDQKNVQSMSNDPAIKEFDPVFTGSHENAATSDLSAELSVPYEDILQLEWLSTFVEDSFSGGGMTLAKDSFCSPKEPQFQSSSPVSVLESSSSSSSSGDKTTVAHRGPRSKRPRPPTFNPRAAIQLISSPPPPSLVVPPKPVFSSESQNFTGSPSMKQKPMPNVDEPKKNKKIKITLGIRDCDEGDQAVRKCLHCEITKTPQWRAGPLGPKTLCNACGVRYKSGRLFPEYRPAASPTFVPSIHSNSHKKVLEMRGKDVVDPKTAATTIKPEFAPTII